MRASPTFLKKKNPTSLKSHLTNHFCLCKFITFLLPYLCLINNATSSCVSALYSKHTTWTYYTYKLYLSSTRILCYHHNWSLWFFYNIFSNNSNVFLVSNINHIIQSFDYISSIVLHSFILLLKQYLIHTCIFSFIELPPILPWYKERRILCLVSHLFPFNFERNGI